MPREVFDRQLIALRDDVVQLGGLVEQRIEQAVRSLVERDDAQAQRVLDADREVDALRFRIEEQCIVLFATQAPVASDLRWIAAALIIVGELERIGDYAVGIAKLALRINATPLLKPLIDIPRMAEICRQQLVSGMAAYAARDAGIARQVIAADADIDLLYQQVLRELLTFMIEDPGTISRATYLLWVAHNFERIGDRATNLAERVIFAVTGRIVESRTLA
jgi:phosphate transport system protein